MEAAESASQPHRSLLSGPERRGGSVRVRRRRGLGSPPDEAMVVSCGTAKMALSTSCATHSSAKVGQKSRRSWPATSRADSPDASPTVPARCKPRGNRRDFGRAAQPHRSLPLGSLRGSAARPEGAAQPGAWIASSRSSGQRAEAPHHQDSTFNALRHQKRRRVRLGAARPSRRPA